ncbi:hypothetical protein QZH41_003346 [Actinostola sp. cb2023]|nr:hypothetical protein QZH41_003346 [Actinostola sp. cb2023]
MIVDTNGKLILEYPGHTGYRKAPVNGVSVNRFVQLRVKKGGSVTTLTPRKVQINADTFQKDYGAAFDSANIPVTATKKTIEQKGPSLARPDCPHGYETFATASPTLYNPCGTGLHVWTKSNISYIVTHNVSKTIYEIVWNGPVSSLQSKVIYYLYHETRYNVTYNIGCNFQNFILLPGQSCSLKQGNYSYNSLTIQGDATMKFEASTVRNKVTFLTTNKLTIKAGGNIQALPSDFDNVVAAQSNQGGSYGGLGGGNNNQKSVYGSIYTPMDYGSFGGGAVASRGKGGGALTIITQQLYLDGTVDASGKDGQNGAGGGSGGSVFITSTLIEGSGTLRARGGTSTTNSGGGGRIAVHASHSMEKFQGSYDVDGGNRGSKGGSLLSSTGLTKSLNITSDDIKIESNARISANGGGLLRGVGSPKVSGSGAGHGGQGGGKDGGIAYGSVFEPKHFGSGFSKRGGGIIYMNVKNTLTINGYVSSDGEADSTGGGSGGTAFMKARRLDGHGEITCNGGAGSASGGGSGGRIAMYVTDYAYKGLVSAFGGTGKDHGAADEGGTLNLAPKLFITRTQSTPSLYLGGRLIGGQEIIIGQNALVVVAKTGVIGSTSATPGKFLFRSLQVSSGGRVKFESDVNLKTPVEIQSLSIDIAYGGIMEGSYLLVKTPSLNIAFNGILRADELGHQASQGPGAGVGRKGGSYGGCGGGSCKLYGSLYRAQEFGSGGGRVIAGNSNEGYGGGIIELKVDSLTVDGVISSNGGSALNTTAGGSGGTVNITVAVDISGRGKIEASGGNGSVGQTGAGGGGRVSILINGRYNYNGQLYSKGGRGGSLSGSPGTVYIEENRPGVRSKRLIIDNRGNEDHKVNAYLNETGIDSYSFNKLGLYGRVVLHLEKNAILHKVISDDKSTLHVQDNVILVIEPDSKSLQPDYSIHVDRDGEIRIPDVVSFRGVNNIFAGTLTGVLDMIIDVNRKTQFSASARTARFIDGKYTYITNRGEYQFSTLKIKRLAMLSFENARLKKIPLTVGTLELNYGAVLQGSWMDIRASSIEVNSGALIDLSGYGNVNEAGPGAGGTVGSSGTGAGHGGFGGLSSGNHGRWYGSAMIPNNTGSGGGNGVSGSGGFGGGFLYLKVVKTLQVDGEIRTDGKTGSGLHSGGGSGGSIFISTDDITGNGVISSAGGYGNGTGGGGSGGRIAIYTQKSISFEGTFKTFGGTGKALGAAGTVFIQDNNKFVPRKRLWIENTKTPGSRPTTVLSEPSIDVFYFDELKMIGSVRFEIHSSPELELIINIKKFNADGVGEMAVKRNQTLYAEVLEAKESHLTLTTNVHIEEGANMVVASSLTVDGATLRIDGKISNGQDLMPSRVDLVQDTEVQEEPIV